MLSLSLIVMLFRIKRRSFSIKDLEQFTGYCHVIVLDFQTHLANCFNTLFSLRTVNELSSCSPRVTYNINMALSSKQQKSVVQKSGRRGVQLKLLEFYLSKLVKSLKVLLPVLFANDLCIADSLTH